LRAMSTSELLLSD